MSIEKLLQENTQAVLNLTDLIRTLSASGLKPIVIDENTDIAKAVAAPIELVQDFVQAPAAVIALPVLRQAFIELGEKRGKDAQMGVLKEFGAAKLSNIDPDQFAAVYEVVQMMLGAGDE